MIYNLANEYERDAFKEKCNTLYKEGAIVEIKKKNKNRTLKQNNYLHLILSFFASKYYCSAGEAKVDFFKRTCNKEIFERKIINKHGVEVTYLRSTADLDTAELSLAIERFRNWSSSVAEIYIPSAEDKEHLIYAEQEIERNKEFI